MCPGKFEFRRHIENNQAETTINEGLMNSEGWILKPKKLIHLRAPFTSSPTIKVNKTSAIDTKSKEIAKRRIFLSFRKETMHIVASANGKNRNCLLTKWKES
tara:strand:+ start:502 stop:807 length:306 start_codon:yes stop_codon:yes gene_type:complete